MGAVLAWGPRPLSHLTSLRLRGCGRLRPLPVLPVRNLFMYSSVHSSIHSFIRPFMHSCIHA